MPRGTKRTGVRTSAGSNVSITWGARTHTSRNGGPLVDSGPPLHGLGARDVFASTSVVRRSVARHAGFPLPVQGALEVADPRAEPARHLGESLAPEDEQGDEKNHEQLWKANRSHVSPRCPRRLGRGSGCQVRA